MKINFCTLYNSAYLSRGLALHQSILEQCPDFHLYVFAFDDACYEYLKSQDLKNLTVISLKEFEDKALLDVKPDRSAAEYCWTCTPSTILYCLEKFKLENCTYIDADMFFYADPTVLVEEMGDNSVLITDHRYTTRYDQSATSGKYCVQFVTFKNNQQGLIVLNWWRNACIEWCYNRFEDGKFGDQKYLDDWTKRFEGVHELQHLGGGVAPWNVQQYNFSKNGSKITGTELKTGKTFQLIFYHFHSLKFFEHNLVVYCDTDYDLEANIKTLIYEKYLKTLMRHYNHIKSNHPQINANGVFGPAPFETMGFKTILKYYRQNLKAGRRYLLGFKLLRQIRNHYYYHLKRFS